MLARAVDHVAHALGDRLVLRHQALDATVGAALLDGAVDLVVVVEVGLESPAVVPAAAVGQELHWRYRARDRAAVLELAQRHGALGPEEREDHGVGVVHRHPQAGLDVVGEGAVGRQGDEREDEVRKTMIDLPVPGRTVGRVHRAPVRVLDVIARRAVGQVEAVQAVGRDLVGLQGAEMQEAEMRGVDVALERLQPVALALVHARDALVLGQRQALDVRHWRRLLTRPHVGPDQAATLHHLVDRGAHAIGELLVGRQVGHVEAPALGVEFPTVIGAADAVALGAAEEQRCAAVRAAVIHNSDPTPYCRGRRSAAHPAAGGASATRRP